MRNKNIKKILIFSVVFVVGLLIVIGEGKYKATLLKESASIMVNISGEDLKPIVYDVADQGIPKKIVQPGKISISTGHGTGIVNKNDEPVKWQVKATGFTADVTISSSEKNFDKNSNTFIEAIDPGKGVNLSIVLDIPRSKLNKNSISTGNLEFTDVDSGKTLAKLPISVINSSIDS